MRELVALAGEFVVTGPVVRRDARARLDRLQCECLERLCRPVRDDTQPQTPRVEATATRKRSARSQVAIRLGLLAALAPRDDTDNKRFMVLPAPFAMRAASETGLVHLDRERGADAIAVWTHHGGP